MIMINGSSLTLITNESFLVPVAKNILKYDIVGYTSMLPLTPVFQSLDFNKKKLPRITKNNYNDYLYKREELIPIIGDKYGNFNGLKLYVKDDVDIEFLKSKLHVFLKPAGDKVTCVIANIDVATSDKESFLEVRRSLGMTSLFDSVLNVTKNAGRKVLSRILNEFKNSVFDRTNIEKILMSPDISNSIINVLSKFYKEKFNASTEEVISISLLRELNIVRE